MIKLSEISQTKTVFLVLFISFLALLPAWLNYDIISRDGAFQYVPSAVLFYEGSFKEAILGNTLPLFPMMIALIARITGLDFELSGRLIAGCCFLIAAAGMFKVSEIIFRNRWISLISVLFLITNRDLIERSIDCLKESLLLCFILWGNYFILKGVLQGYRNKDLALGGAILFLGALVRSTSLVFLGAWLVIWVFHKRKNVIFRALLLVVPAIAVFMLWYFDPSLPIFRKSFKLSKLFHTMPGISGFLYSTYVIVSNFISTGNHFIMVIGCFGLYKYRNDRYKTHVIIVFAFFYLMMIRMGHTGMQNQRYVLAPIVWFYPLAAYAVVSWLSAPGKVKKRIAVVVLLAACLFWAGRAFTPPDSDKLARKKAGEYILSQAGPEQRVLTNRDRLAYYAKGEYVKLDAESDIDNPQLIIAVDVQKAEVREVKARLDTIRKTPARQFKTIYVYLPES
ncbi:MAG: hypothetical protein JW920_12070 [Deltaproteobacteria bacterium]|nr:hypothetical protein [Deltaproteobacteria bacterium]